MRETGCLGRSEGRYSLGNGSQSHPCRTCLFASNAMEICQPQSRTFAIKFLGETDQTYLAISTFDQSEITVVVNNQGIVV